MSKTEEELRALQRAVSDRAARRLEPSGHPASAHDPPAAEPGGPWRRARTYEFQSAEGALLAVTCVVALAMATEAWPVLELRRRRLSLRWPSGVELTPRRRSVWGDLDGWVRHLGGREVTVVEEGAAD